MHASGRALDSLCMGLCAILRFPLFDEVEEESTNNTAASTNKTKVTTNTSKKTGDATIGKAGEKEKNITSGKKNNSKVKSVTKNTQAQKAAQKKKKQAANKAKQKYGNDTFGGGDYYD